MMKYLFLLLIIFSSLVGMNKKIEKIDEKTLLHTKEDSDVDDNQHCLICYERYNKAKERIDILCDSERKIYHTYCKPCINDWLKKNKFCPTCQRPIDSNAISEPNFFSYILAHLQKFCCYK